MTHRPRKPYHECPRCGSAAVERKGKLLSCIRCGYEAKCFHARPSDPYPDLRPRDAGIALGGGFRILPTNDEE